MRNKCEVCGSKHYKAIFEDVVICDNCGFAYRKGVSQRVTDKYYIRMEKKNYYLKNLPIPPLYIKQQKLSAEYIKQFITPSMKILDVGCYFGYMMKLLKDYDVSGLDPSASACKIASQYGEVYNTSVFNHKIKKKFDCIILTHVLEHIVDLRKFVLKISELLNTEGIVIIESPDACHFELVKKRGFINDQKEPLLQFSSEHVNYFDLGSLQKLFKYMQPIDMREEASTLYVVRGVFEKKYDWRIVFSLFKHRDQSLEEFEEYNKVFKLINKPICIYGLGAFTKKLLKYTNLKKLDIKGFVDDTTTKKSYRGIPIIKKPIKRYPVLIGSLQHKDTIVKKLKGYKVITL